MIPPGNGITQRQDECLLTSVLNHLGSLTAISCGSSITDGPCLLGTDSQNWRKTNIYEEITNDSKQKIIHFEDSKCRNLKTREIPLNKKGQRKLSGGKLTPSDGSQGTVKWR